MAMRLAVLPLVVVVVVGAGLAPGAVWGQWQGTPVATPVGSADSAGLGEMLRLAPDALDGPNPPEERIAAYTDYAAQLAAVGFAPPESAADESSVSGWIRATQALPLPGAMGVLGPLEEQVAALGFDIFQVDRALEVWLGADGGETVTFLRGRFEAGAVEAVWAGNGYAAEEVEGAKVVERPIGAAFADFWTALDDGTLVVGSSVEAVRAALDVVAGRAPSLAEWPEVAALLGGGRADLASALLLTGAALDRLPEAYDVAEFNPRLRPSDVATIEAQAAVAAELGELPPVRLALLGVTAGGPVPPTMSRSGEPTPTPEAEAGSAARFAISLLMEDRAAAEAAAGIVEARLERLQTVEGAEPFADLDPERSVTVAAEAPVVLIDLAFARDRAGQPDEYVLWFRRFGMGELLFVYW
jgi:hypothetical protein